MDNETKPAAAALEPPLAEPVAARPANEAPPNARAPKPRKGTPRGKRGLRLPRRFKKAAPGSAAGIEPHDLTPVTSQRPSVRVTCIDYSPQRSESEEVQDVQAFKIGRAHV